MQIFWGIAVLALSLLCWGGRTIVCFAPAIGAKLGLSEAVPFWYRAILIFIWDRDMGFRQATFSYWVFVWGMWPVFGILEGVYCFTRLME